MAPVWSTEAYSKPCYAGVVWCSQRPKRFLAVLPALSERWEPTADRVRSVNLERRLVDCSCCPLGAVSTPAWPTVHCQHGTQLGVEHHPANTDVTLDTVVVQPAELPPSPAVLACEGVVVLRPKRANVDPSTVHIAVADELVARQYDDEIRNFHGYPLIGTG